MPRRSALIALAVVVAVVPTTTAAAAPASHRSVPDGNARWGMMGGWSGVSMDDLRSRGVSVVDVALDWASAEPTEGGWNEAYFAAKRDEIGRLRDAGFKIVLNYGLHHAPAWFLDRPGLRYVDQFGNTYLDSDEPNLVWAGPEDRALARRYTGKVFEELGEHFIAVRVGGGHWGELTYPQLFDGSGHLLNRYWAYDENARRQTPEPGWRPCDPSPDGEARRFLDWYLDSLTRYQNRQIHWIRQGGFHGTVAVLYASWGMRTGDFEAAVDTNLCGTSSAEINGEVQRGFDHRRHIRSLPRRGDIAVWGTWVEESGAIRWLAALAERHGFAIMGENAGNDDADGMQTTVNNARELGLSLLMWVRAEQAYCFCDGLATIDDYERLIS